MRVRSAAALLIAHLCAAGCTAAERGASASATVRDSAGVRIVEHAGAGVDAGVRIDTTPAFSIGVLDGEAAYQFQQVTTVQVQPDGGVLVLDGGSAQLRRYDGAGRHRWSFGRSGDGPGEFRAPSYLGRYADGSFALWDRSQVRLTVVRPDGTLGHTTSYAAESGRQPAAYGLFADSALLAVFPTPASPPAPGTLFVDTIGYWRVDRPRAEPRLLARYPGTIWIWTGRAQLPVPFTANALRALRGDQIVVASGAAAEVYVHDGTDGRLVARYAVARAPVSVGSDHVRRLVTFQVEQFRGYGAPLAEWEEWLGRMPVPPVRPAYDRLVVSATGELWLRQYVPMYETEAPSVWDLFAADGAYRGEVHMPPRLEVMSVGEAWVAGVMRDESDVESVRVYPIARGK